MYLHDTKLDAIDNLTILNLCSSIQFITSNADMKAMMYVTTDRQANTSHTINKTGIKAKKKHVNFF